VSEAIKPLKKPMLLACGANIKLCGENCSRYTFLCGQTTWNMSFPAVDWFLNTLGKKVYFIGTELSTGHDVVKFFRDPFEKKGGRWLAPFLAPWVPWNLRPIWPKSGVEEFYQGLMICYQRLNQETEARAAYHRCRKILSSTIGVEPSSKTEAIYQSIMKNVTLPGQPPRTYQGLT